MKRRVGRLYVSAARYITNPRPSVPEHVAPRLFLCSASPGGASQLPTSAPMRIATQVTSLTPAVYMGFAEGQANEHVYGRFKAR